MKYLSLIAAGLGLAVLIAGAPVAQAHSTKQCKKMVKSYRTACKLSPTARLVGMCIVTKTLKACSDPKKHDDTFHK